MISDYDKKFLGTILRESMVLYQTIRPDLLVYSVSFGYGDINSRYFGNYPL